MTLSIDDPEVDRLAQDVAAVTGESLAEAVKRSLAERLEREQGKRREATVGAGPQAAPLQGQALIDMIDEIARRCAAAPTFDDRTPDEIIGYDEHGLPS